MDSHASTCILHSYLAAILLKTKNHTILASSTKPLHQMKSIFLLVTSLLFASISIAQNNKQLELVNKATQTDNLRELSKTFRQEANRNKSRAIAKARQKGWAIKKTVNGRFMELQALDAEGNPLYLITDNANAAISVSTNELYSGGSLGLSLDGTGMIAGEWDGGGTLTTHNEFNNTGSSRVNQMDFVEGTHYHATHVAGTIMGGGAYSPAKGMAYNASLSAYDWNTDESEMATEAANGLLISNHSYGYIGGYYWNGTEWLWNGFDLISDQEDYKFGFYNSYAQDWDEIAFNAPYYLIVKSAGNDRGDGPADGDYPQDGPYDCIIYNGIAKNILTVGATEDVAGGYSGDPADVVMSDFSSWGPADDGRIKPDICGNGVGLTSAYNSADNAYASMSGTSMSSPSVTGSLLLLQEYYYDLYNTYMKSATLKALVLHTADECGPDDGPDYMFGWGLLNSETSADLISTRNVESFIKEESYSGSDIILDVSATGLEPLIVTIVWTDPAGTPPSSYSLDPSDIMLVNDLDLTVSDGGTTHYPYMLDKDNPSDAATTGDNDVDNVEKIYIASPSASTYTITISLEGSLTNSSQDFALIVSGIENDIASIATYEPTNVLETTADISGEVINDNSSTVTESGFVYSTSTAPTTADSYVSVSSGVSSYSTSLSGLTVATTYYIRAYAINGNGTAYGDEQNITTRNSTTWSGSSWSNGTPAAGVDAIINGNFAATAGWECETLTINSSYTFTLGSTDYVTVNGNLTVAGTFNIESDATGAGSLITYGSIENTGTINIERYVTSVDWHLISVPNNNTTASTFVGDYLEPWDETTGSWSNITDVAATLSPLQGYGYQKPSGDANTYTFTGTPNTGSQSIEITYTEIAESGYDGANLLGNPYPSSIDWSDLDNIYGAVYYWDGVQYASWNNGEAINGGTQYIPPMQGFFIVLEEHGGNFNLTNAHRTHTGADNYYKEAQTISNGIVLAASNGSFSDELYIKFDEDTSDEYELWYDAYKFLSNTKGLPQLYSITNEIKFSIDVRPETGVIQLGYQNNEDGVYQIGMKEMDGISGAFLEDTKLDIFHNLEGEDYLFEWSVNDSEKRFKFHLSTTATENIQDDIDNEFVKIYTYNKQLYIRSEELLQNVNILVIDMLGRSVYEKQLNTLQEEIISLPLRDGVYTVIVKSASLTQIQKIIFN